MNTKKLIYSKSKELFSKKGFKNTTLRDIAKELHKSYGNITYHYKTKKHLLEELLNEFNLAFHKNEKKLNEISSSMEKYLYIPELNFRTIKSYLFFIMDEMELKRNYPILWNKMNSNNNNLKNNKIEILKELQSSGYLKHNLTLSAMEYIVELSNGITLLYFQKTSPKNYDKKAYSKKVNKLLFPYLTDKGKLVYIKH